MARLPAQSGHGHHVVQAGGRLTGQMRMVTGGGIGGQREGALDHPGLRGRDLGAGRIAIGDQGIDMRTQRRQRVVAPDGAQDVERDDVAGALPD